MGKIAMVFSGQGAQYSGMGKELYDVSKSAKEVFDTCDTIRPNTSTQCFEGTKQELMSTINTQPCLFCVDLAAAMSVIENGIVPQGVAGFSLGEFAAVCVSNVLSITESFDLVCKRAQLMHAASEESQSTLAAIVKLSTEKVEQLCAQFGSIYPVNYNCEGQVVVAGKQDALLEFANLVKENGGKALPLSVSGGFHSPYMDGAAEALKKHLEGLSFGLPSIPIYANATALPYTDNAKEMLAMQVNHPVLWQRTIENMVADGFDIFIEVGAGKTLSSLIKKIAPQVQIYNVQDKESLEATIEQIKEVK